MLRLRYRVLVGTERGAVLDFPQYGQGEKLTAFAFARFQSGAEHTPWTEVWDERRKMIRYIDAMPVWWSEPEVFRDHSRSFMRYGIFSPRVTITDDGEDGYDDGWDVSSRR